MLTLAGLTKACAKKPKAGRKARRVAIKKLKKFRAIPSVRAEAIRGIQRSCGACGRCKGV